MLRAREVTKKPKPKAITKDKMGRNQKNANRAQRQKAGTGNRMNSEKMVNSVGDMNSAGRKFPRYSNFLVFSTLLSF